MLLDIQTFLATTGLSCHGLTVATLSFSTDGCLPLRQALHGWRCMRRCSILWSRTMRQWDR